MRTLIILGIGIFIGSKISNIHAYNLSREKEVRMRKQLESFFDENLPGFSLAEIQQKITTLLKG